MSEQKTLLDEFAISAMYASIAGCAAHYGYEEFWTPRAVAFEAYEMAEAMMAEKKKRESKND